MMRLKLKNAFFSSRAPWWDYDADGVYFITINVAWRKRLLGNVVNGKMLLSQEGELIKQLWEEIPARFPSMTLDAFVVMPDHFHGILCKRAIHRAPEPDKHEPTVSGQQNQGGFAGSYNPVLHENVSTAVCWFKGRSAFEARKINLAFGWQPRFYDVRMRSQGHLERTRQYIRSNPEKWCG